MLFRRHLNISRRRSVKILEWGAEGLGSAHYDNIAAARHCIASPNDEVSFEASYLSVY